LESDEKKFWKLIYYLDVPSRIKLFVWRACKNMLPTKISLASRLPMVVEMNCAVCKAREESDLHALHNRPFVEMV